MTTIAGRDCKIEVALTFDSPLTVTALTLANPGVATSAAHGAAQYETGYFSVSAGTVEIDGQAVYLSAVDTNTMTLGGLNTTSYSAWSAGTLTLAATWGTLSESAGYSVGGGAAAQLDDTRLMDIKTRNVAGLLAPQDVTIDVRSPITMGSALTYVADAALSGTSCLFKITKGSTVLRVFYGVPSIPGESVSAGGLGSGQFNVLCPAWVTKPNV